MGSVLANAAESLGDKVKISGIARNRESVTVTLEVVVADGSGGGTGITELTGLQIGNSSSGWSVVVPSNRSPGPFHDGGTVLVQTIMRNPAGETMYVDGINLPIGQSPAERAEAARRAAMLAEAQIQDKVNDWVNTAIVEECKKHGRNLALFEAHPLNDWAVQSYKENGRFPDAAWVAKTYVDTGKWPTVQ
ncbi:hypothetical protein [Nocardia alba]|uniref:Uncharacterized protein n=1 Tax=Nocardia alba TaxID=225051 RepID=A0A4R1FGI6_9NOCA|nr:hypothetical protein [Nocardia alba]TCJ89951.1 hypothetical protein DFR71_6241 [Nocardia alba]